jgi:hypothetical protein
MRSFHEQIKKMPSSLFLFLGWSSLSSALLMIGAVHLDFFLSILVFCCWMRWTRFVLCSATADFSADVPVSDEHPVCSKYATPHTCGE